MPQPTDSCIVFDTPAGIEGARILSMRSALRLETLGMTHSRGSVYAYIKREFGFKGNKVAVLGQLETWIEDNMGIPRRYTKR